MIIINRSLMATFSAPGNCENCGKWFEQRECHHLWSRGADAGQRLDISVALMGLCFFCHDKCPGILTRTHCLMIVARREKVDVQDIIDVVYFLRRLRKDAAPIHVKLALIDAGLKPSGEALAWRMLEGHLEEAA